MRDTGTTIAPITTAGIFMLMGASILVPGLKVAGMGMACIRTRMAGFMRGSVPMAFLKGRGS